MYNSNVDSILRASFDRVEIHNEYDVTERQGGNK